MSKKIISFSICTLLIITATCIPASSYHSFLEQKNNLTLIKIQIHEGKKRQIKRMMKAIGHPVIHLRRIQFAGLTLCNLLSGEWRELNKQEVDKLYQIT